MLNGDAKMPNFDYVAREIISYLLQDPQSPLPVDDSGEAIHTGGDWLAMADTFAYQYLRASWELLPRADYWQGLSRMFQGAYQLSRGELLCAADRYRWGEQAFGRARQPFSQAVALMALGRVFHAQGDLSLASQFYDQSRQISSGLAAWAQINPDGGAERLYSSFCGRLIDLRAQAKRPAEARFLRVVEAMAGEPLYEPGEDCTAVIDAVWIEEERFQFLSMRNRYPIKCYFSPDERFFLVHVKGHSMNGGQYQIRDRDVLLAKHQDTRPAEREVAVFQEENSGPLVKIFRSHPGRIVLESANPRFKDRTYNAHSPTLRVLGVARAILQPEQRN